MGGRWLYVRAVECTFYLQGDLLQPWGEELDPVPGRWVPGWTGMAITMSSTGWCFTTGPASGLQEASIWLSWAEPDTGVH